MVVKVLPEDVATGSSKLSSYHPSEGKDAALNTCDVSQNLFVWGLPCTGHDPWTERDVIATGAHGYEILFDVRKNARDC